MQRPDLLDGAPLSTLDLISAVMGRPERPLDFVLLIHFGSQVPSLGALRRGGASARCCFPTTGATIRGRVWTVCQQAEDAALEERHLAGPEALSEALQRFTDGPFDPRSTPPLTQLLLHDSQTGKTQLATRCHHAAADLLSAVFWLTHQLDVAAGRREPVEQRMSVEWPVIQHHPQPVRKSRYAHMGRSRALWTRGRRPGRSRRWRSFELESEPLRSLVAQHDDFTYNDVLGAAALETAAEWNRAHDVGTDRISLWFPVNIRQRAFQGFGNGTSRIRIYRRSSATEMERCRLFREQVAWSKRHGEWAVPQRHPVLKLPLWISVPLLRAYFNRPWVDMGSLLFSHAEHLGAGPESVFPEAERFEVVADLDRQHPLGLAGATLGGRTQLTMTWDPALLSDADIDSFLESYRARVARVQGELEA